MKVQFIGRNHKISKDLEEYVSAKVEKVTQLGVASTARLDVKVSENEHAKVSDSALKTELTVISRGPAIRSEATGSEEKETFDLAFKKLIERLRRAHDKKKHIARKGRRKKTSTAAVTALPEQAGLQYSEDVEGGVIPDPIERIFEESKADLTSASNHAEEEDYSSPVVIRRKAFPATEMKVEDAVDNMELLGHDFYLFIEEDSKQPHVVYRRKGWDYGVITLEEGIEEASDEEVINYKAK
ncbi:MAG: HPF/RaiA family ribosome-associated protein [Micrococcaceae bacterium]